MNTKAFFPYGGGLNLILGIGKETNIFSENSSCCQVFFFTKLSKNDILVQNKIIPHPDAFV